ncbi:MAG: DUF1405 domain-containing protein [Thermoplasmatota archaeon]
MQTAEDAHRSPTHPWPREIFDLFHEFKVRRGWLTFILATNTLGIVYGFYYYFPQFATTPWYLWLFVPDSPLAVFWETVAITLWIVKRRSDFFDALGFAAMVQVGWWTAYVLFAYRDSFNTFNFGSPDWDVLNFVLFWGHLGMALESLVLVADLRRSFARNARRMMLVLGAVLVWMLANDAIDYFAPFTYNGYADCPGLRPYTVPCFPSMESALAAVTFALSFAAVGILAYWTRPRGGSS